MLLFAVPAASAQGIIVPSAGPINSAMAGASTAAPVDFGASYWNPAILSGLDGPEFLLGSALAFPSIHMESASRPTRSAVYFRRRIDTARREAIAGSHPGWPRASHSR